METVFCITSEELRARALKELSSVPLGHDFILKKHVKSKTTNQRRYFHKILQLVCDYTGDSIEHAKMQIKYAVLPLIEVKVNGTVYMHPISSEKATRAQYADLINAALMFASEAGVFVPSASHWGYDI